MQCNRIITVIIFRESTLLIKFVEKEVRTRSSREKRENRKLKSLVRLPKHNMYTLVHALNIQ